ATIATLLRGEEGRADALGQTHIEGQRLFDESGHEMVRSDHPALIARRTGIPQRQRIFGIRSVNGPEAWVQLSYMPLEATPDGWSILGVGTILPRPGYRTPVERAQEHSSYSGPLLQFALEIAGARLPRAELAQRMRGVVET